MFQISIAIILAILASTVVFLGSAFASARIQRQQIVEKIDKRVEQKLETLSTPSPEAHRTGSRSPEDPAPIRKPHRDPAEHRTPLFK